MSRQHWVKHLTPLWHLNWNVLFLSSLTGSTWAIFSGLSMGNFLPFGILNLAHWNLFEMPSKLSS
jgi:hypothetical protein